MVYKITDLHRKPRKIKIKSFMQWIKVGHIWVVVVGGGGGWWWWIKVIFVSHPTFKLSSDWLGLWQQNLKDISEMYRMHLTQSRFYRDMWVLRCTASYCDSWEQIFELLNCKLYQELTNIKQIIFFKRMLKI